MGNGVCHHTLAKVTGVQVNMNAAVPQGIAAVLPDGFPVGIGPALEHMDIYGIFCNPKPKSLREKEKEKTITVKAQKHKFK